MYRITICGIGMGSRQTANRLLRRRWWTFSSIVEKVVRHAGCSVLIDRRLDHAGEDAAAQTEGGASL